MRENPDWTDAYTTKPVGSGKRASSRRAEPERRVTQAMVFKALARLKHAAYADSGDEKGIARAEREVDRLMRRWGA